MYRVQRDLPVGEWRVVENFKISGTGGQYRPTKLQYKMTILGDTTIIRTDYRNDNHFLSPARYEEIGTENLKTYFLIDILGQVVKLGRIMTVEVKGEERKRVLFRLRDTSGNEVACCLWGQYAEQIESHISESKDDTIICLIRFAKISEFRGELQITNAYDASLLMLNPTMEEAIDFKQKYKLHVFVKDDTGESELMLLDTVATTIIGNKAEELWDGSYAMNLIISQIEDPEILPIPIKNLVGKSFCFGLSITSDNVSNGSTTFKVAEVWSGDHIHRIESLSEPVSLIGSSSSTLSTSEVLCIDHNKESSSEDVTTPFSKRKEGDAELNDMNSTSKKLCAKNIKMEKTKED
ncbi:BnaCnng11370D [Brassica napus]|uniref:BnaCnng11370D protein n=1 Tax=Brassica napus TaxID=3708 RepID=A0A078I3W2_BRANA|nr:BnaCnng11370D [Brassica napus]